MSITPEELKQYSVFEDVLERPDPLLKMDILEAETYINKKISRPLTELVPLPETLRLALLKVAQYFALVNSDESINKGYKSEKIGDYSYTLSDGSSVSVPDVTDLIADFIDVTVPTEGNVFLRMRAL